MTITVYGIPGPKGSKRPVGRDRQGRAIMIESSAKVKPWMEAVKWAIIESRVEGTRCIAGPVRAEITFTLVKPKSAPKKRVTFPDRKMDIDKLCRSTLDALVQCGVIEDDGRVVELAAFKRFPLEGTDSLASPGAVIRITEVV